MMTSLSSEQFHEIECTPKCRSHTHAQNILSCVTKATPSEIRAYCLWLCHNFTTVTDDLGRNLLHLVCSCGKWEIVEWLLDHCNCEVDVRDSESGWTALHRSLYYGHINVARILLSHGASLRMTDHEGLTPLDIILKDRLPYVEYLSNGPSEVYVWGSNTNYNLGLGNEQNREYPEILDSFRKDCISIKQVVVCKFHSVFLSSDGRLFSCGHGYGGRLGQASENTSVAPALIHGVGSIPCEQVAAGQDHLMLLMQGGQVWTCGLNVYHQLGHSPPPERLVSPRPLSLKFLKGKNVVGVCAARFHSVFYTKDSVFTFGLNAGQLGHPKGDRTQILPRQVSALYNKEWTLTHVTASDGATVCATDRGDVFVLHEYQHRKIASRQRGIKKVSVVGGNLDSHCDAAGVKEGGGLELRVVILTESGKVFLWRQSDPFLRRCLFTPGRQLVINDIHLNHYTVGLVTNENEAFLGTILSFKPKKKPADGTISLSSPPCKPQNPLNHLNVLLERDECILIRAKRIQYIHRANAITCDAKGRNFAVLQSSPKIGLVELPEVTASEIHRDMKSFLDEVHLHDNFHDVIIKVEEKYYPAHSYILASRCEFFRKQFQGSAGSSLSGLTIPVDGIKSAAFEQVLKYVYTDSCDFLTENFEVKRNASICQAMDKISDLIDIPKSDSPKGSKAPQSKKKSNKKDKDSTLDTDPLKNVRDASRRLNMHVLTKQLEGVKLVSGKVKVECFSRLPKLAFDRHKFLNLCDVTLTSQDGIKFPCHRCILACRLEYFHSMLGSCWMETSLESLSLPISSDILDVILDYLYTGNAPGVFASEDPEFVCHVLVIADQLLIIRLKEMCEMALVELLTLKNASELLQLAFVYNAVQLKKACMEYICVNLPAVIESRSLDLLNSDVMDELSREYRRLVHSMCHRFITPYPGFPTKDELKEVEKLFPVSENFDVIRPRIESISTKGHEIKPGKGKRKSLTQKQDIPLESRQRHSSDPPEKDIILNITANQPEKHIVVGKPEAKEPTIHDDEPLLVVNKNMAQKTAGNFFSSSSNAEEFPELGKIAIEEKKRPRVMPKPISTSTDVRRTSHLSQKQKKMAAFSNKDQVVAVPAPLSSHGNQINRITPACPWGKQASQDIPSQSFWDIVPKGENQNLLELSSPGSSLQSSPASPTSPDVLKRYGSVTTTTACGSHGGQPVIVSLEAIQRAEQEELHSQIQPKIKSLHLINVEDQAIEELLIMYKAKDNPNEKITVSRVLPDKIAKPVWKKKARVVSL